MRREVVRTAVLCLAGPREHNSWAWGRGKIREEGEKRDKFAGTL